MSNKSEDLQQLNAFAHEQYEQLRKLTLANTVDFERLNALHIERDRTGSLIWEAQYPELAYELQALTEEADGYSDSPEAVRAVVNHVTACLLRSDWTASRCPLSAAEYCLLIGKTLPQARIVGKLNAASVLLEAETATLEVCGFGHGWRVVTVSSLEEALEDFSNPGAVPMLVQFARLFLDAEGQNGMNAQHTVFFVPGKPYIHDLLIDRDGALTGKYGGERVSQLWAQHPTGIVTTLQEANAAIDQQATTPPKEITKERFWYLLEVLPPVRWINGEHTESFRVSECITGTVYTAGVRLGERYFELQQPISVTHDQLVALCKAVQA